VVAGVVLIASALGVSLRAQTPTGRVPSGRVLFVVETSAAMSRRAPAVQTMIGNLLSASLHGQLRRGDTVGVWTFDDELHAGKFPLKAWTPEANDKIAGEAVAFLKAHRYEKKSRLEAVWPSLQRLFQESERLTVVLVTDGDDEFSGTPYDRELNSAFREHFKAQQKTRMPFATVLRSRRGQFIGATLNLAPWPIEFPVFPPEPRIAEAPKPKSTPPQKKPEPPPKLELTLIGTNLVASPATNPTSLPANPLKSDPPKPALATNAPAANATEPPKSPPQETVAATAPPLSAGTSAAPKVDAAAPPPVSVPVTAPKVEPPVSEPKTVAPSPVTPEPKLSELPSPAVSPAPALESKRLEPAPTPSAPAQEKKELPAPSGVVTAPPANLASPSTSAATSPTDAVSETASPAQVAVATNPPAPRGGSTLVLIGIGVLVLGGVMFFVLRRRANASLITQSLDQRRK